MTALLGPNGAAMETYMADRAMMEFKKEAAPPTGPAFGQWSGRDLSYARMPGGTMLGFDLDSLTLGDFRAMKEHPTINSSLSVLTFMLHQVDWNIECKDKAIADFVEENLRTIWTRLIRALSQSFWAGFSPSAIEYDNNPQTGRIEISKIKDLIPEDCQVHWKEVEGSYSPPNTPKPKFKIYDGIDQWGAPFPIPPDNSLWYPLLMENGNMYGRKLLKPAFMPWYFSLLIHLFANRYFERFGEPTIYGRAPFDEDVTYTDDSGNEVTKSGKQVMEQILSGLRNRSMVVLPSDRDPAVTSAGANRAYEWEIDYLESQMRGADFERYMARLDEEMSLSLFTPLLLLRTAGEGSHNLGVQHTQTWLWMLNALTGDLAEYINRYITNRLKGLNFSKNAPDCTWVPRKMGKENVETLRAIITALITGGTAKVDLDELGQQLGLTVKQVRQVTANVSPDGVIDPNNPNPDPRADPARTARDRSSDGPKGVGEARATGRSISNRVRGQVEKAFRENTFSEGFTASFGFKRRFEQALISEGVAHEAAVQMTNDLYGRMEHWVGVTADLGPDEFTGPQDFMSLFDRRLDTEIDSLV